MRNSGKSTCHVFLFTSKKLTNQHFRRQATLEYIFHFLKFFPARLSFFFYGIIKEVKIDTGGLIS